MNTSEIKKDTLKLEPIGTDFWSRPVYKDQYGHTVSYTHLTLPTMATV